MATDQAVMEALARLEKKFDAANERLRDCAKKDDLTAVSIRDKVRENERRLNRMEAERDRMAKSVQKLVEECVEAKVGQTMIGAERTIMTNGTADNALIEAVQKQDYLEACRTIKMWPVKGIESQLEKACREFMKDALGMPEDTAEEITITSVRRIRQARRSKIADEVLVRFGTVDERDIVQSYASNLGKMNGAAGIRIYFPAHLRNVFRLLESHGSLLKKKYPDLKRSIKYDDATLSLVMDVKLTANDAWERVDEKGANDSKKARDTAAEGANTRVNPGGMAGRRALMLSSPEAVFTRGRTTDGLDPNREGWSGNGWNNSNRDSGTNRGSRD